MQKKEEIMDVNVYEFNKRSDEKIVISLSDFRGKKFVHLRTWIDDPEDPGKQKWIRTRKGICIEAGLAEELKKGIDKLLEKLLPES